MNAASLTATSEHEPSAAQLRELVKQAPDGIFVADADGRYTFVNEAGCRMLGYARHELIGKTIFELLPVEDKARLLESKAQMLRGASHVAEWRVRRKDGTWLPVEVSAKILPDGQWQGFVREISERKAHQAECEALLQQARANEHLLQGIFDILPVGVWIADSSGRIVSNNPAGERIWGGARYVGVPQFGQYKGWWVDTGKPIAPEEWALARALTKGETSTGELVRIQCFDGSFKTIINSAAPLRDKNGGISGAIVVNEDITAQHEAQEKLRASEHLFRTVFDLLPVGLWLADREGRITRGNPAGERIWQGIHYVGPEQYGKYKGWWLESGKPIAADEWAILRAVRQGKASRGELIRIQCFDGSFKTVINWAVPMRSEAGEITGAIAVNEDVTTLQQTQEQLRAAVRDREQILATVTHDLRSPLSGIIMAAAAAERQARALPDGEPVRALAASLHDTARHMSGLVDDLLAVAVAKGGGSMLKLAPAAAGALLARAADAARPLLAKQGLRLEVKSSGELPSISVDAKRILRVFSNLLDNALKFTAARGRITLAAETVAGGVKFSVANSGRALPRKELAAMFQPFWQAGRKDRRGAGLGLAICRSMVEAHGGSIWVEPALGERVRVCFVLPRAPALKPGIFIARAL
jgi:PAS domain S-box-containing protein